MPCNCWKRKQSFNPRAPRGARQKIADEKAGPLMFQSTRPARGATPEPTRTNEDAMVSIHAPRAGRDAPIDYAHSRSRSFNPRAPRGARQRHYNVAEGELMFQSTRPARGATRAGRKSTSRTFRFNPRAPRGARPCCFPSCSAIALVSIHAPRAGRDGVRPSSSRGRSSFNPRAPRGARR